jgi:Family of unknown function (DUF5723)
MKNTRLIFILLITFNNLAQNKQILYNFTAIPETLMTNPGADIKYKWFVGVPLLSGISANVGSSGFTAYDLFAKDGVNFNTKLQAVLLSSSKSDKVYLNQQLEIFNAGFKINDDPNSYVSFGMYQEFNLLSFLPADLANLAINGNKDYIGKVYELNELNVNADLLTVFHFGYHKQVNEKFIVGGRAKIYSGIFNVNSTNNGGYLYTIPSNNSIYEQVIVADITVNSSGIEKFTKNGYSGDVKSDIQSDIIKKSFLGGNLGLGFDLGFTYYPKKKVQITASLIDVGFIRNTSDVKNITLKGFYKYEGLSPDLLNSNTISQFPQRISDAIPLDTLRNSYTTWRPIKMNVSYQYSFDNAREKGCNCEVDETTYKNAVGLQVFAMTTTQIPFFAATAYYKKQLLQSIQAKATYTIDSFSYKNIGLGIATTFGKFNFYAMADNLLEYKDVSKANSLSFQFGFNIILKDNPILN